MSALIHLGWTGGAERVWVKRNKTSDEALGMGRPINRRDFIDGVAVAIGAAALVGPAQAPAAPAPAEAQPTDSSEPGYYPPTRTGLRGSHPGSFEAAHALRDGALAEGAVADLDETYDLIVVGGGISGLSAAWFFRQAQPDARILILDNHDDFGGHAKRNEFHLGGGLQLMNGGTLEIDSPRPYSPVAAGLVAALGIDPPALERASDRDLIYERLGLEKAVFFDRETFGRDALVVGDAWEGDKPHRARALAGLLAISPLSHRARADILRIETGRRDYLPGLPVAEKMDQLSRISYRDYLLNVAKVAPEVIAFYQTATHDEWGLGIDGVPALDCWGFGLPGFEGLGLDRRRTRRMGYTAAGYSSVGGSYKFHFPDGNATIARLLVRSLIPHAIAGKTAEDIVTARCDYARLDEPDAPVRIRLNSTAVHVANLGDPATSRGVEMTYLRGGKACRVRGGVCVLAGYNMMIPYLAPELPAEQKAALHQMVKVPLVYATVALANWRAFARLKVRSVTSPGAYFCTYSLAPAQAVGSYTTAVTPDEPILVRMVRTPCKPGAPTERDQHRAGRQELLATPFEVFERNIRDQLGRSLAAGGFDPARDILGVAVNRWPHGYAYEFNPLYDPFDIPDSQKPNVIGRQRRGRIAIANSDAGAAAYTDSAIDQAHRAVTELLA
jgi:spermidine dehydrogenase